MLLVITLQLNSYQLDTINQSIIKHTTRRREQGQLTTLLHCCEPNFILYGCQDFTNTCEYLRNRDRDTETHMIKGNGARPIDLTARTQGIGARLLNPRGYLFDRLQSLLGSIFSQLGSTPFLNVKVRAALI